MMHNPWLVIISTIIFSCDQWLLYIYTHTIRLPWILNITSATKHVIPM